MLKDIVDETSRAKYDFMYLRIGKSLFGGPKISMADSLLTIDFANNCKYVLKTS